MNQNVYMGRLLTSLNIHIGDRTMIGELSHPCKNDTPFKNCVIHEIKADGIKFAPTYHYDESGHLIVDSIDIVHDILPRHN